MVVHMELVGILELVQALIRGAKTGSGQIRDSPPIRARGRAPTGEHVSPLEN